VQVLLSEYAPRDGKEVFFSKACFGMVALDGNSGQTPSQWIDAALTRARTSMALAVDFSGKEASPTGYQ
jgi:hypothetical protein